MYSLVMRIWNSMGGGTMPLPPGSHVPDPIINIFGLGQGPSSKIGINVYLGGEMKNGVWIGGQPLKDADYEVYLSAPNKPVTGKTPSGGWAAIEVPVPSGATTQVSVTYDGETQRKIVHTSEYPGSAMAEFHFMPKPTIKPILIVAALGAAGLGLYTLLKK